MKQFKTIGIIGVLVLLAISIFGYASGDPSKKAPPKRGVYVDVIHSNIDFTVICFEVFEGSGSGPLPPILRWSFKEDHGFTAYNLKMDAYFSPALVWEDRQRSWCENAKVIRFRNYYKSFDKTVASRLCDKPYKSPRHGITGFSSNSLS